MEWTPIQELKLLKPICKGRPPFAFRLFLFNKMTNEEAKQQAIINVYGEYYEQFRKYIDKNGWIAQSDIFLPSLDLPDSFEVEVKGFPPKGATKWRPKQLQGIENNNGWIRIESENDLPKDDIDCHFMSGKYLYNGLWDNELKSFYCGLDKVRIVSHYRPIETPPKPIF